MKDLGDKRQKQTKYDSDESPPRKQTSYKNRSLDASPKRNNYDSDASPPRRNKSSKQSDSDASPPRYKRSPDFSPKRKGYDSDEAPPRKGIKRSSVSRRTSDLSPKRKNVSDSSPPRKIQGRGSPDSYNKNQNINRGRYKTRSPDLSLPRRISPPRKNKKFDNPNHNKSELSSVRKRQNSDPESPPRQSKKNDSPNRNEKYKKERHKKSRWGDRSPQRKNSDLDLSPPRSNYSKKDFKDHSKYSNKSEPSTSQKMEKTLDGKTAGLQNAQDLKHETQAFKNREDELFQKMSEDVSGMNAAPIIRDRKTGKKRDFEKEALEEYAKLKREKEQKYKYDKWGKGLKQVDNMREKIESDIHEMNKPLARYADDEDLEKYLKEQERDGDPMLAYIRKKKKKQNIEVGKPGMYIFCFI